VHVEQASLHLTEGGIMSTQTSVFDLNLGIAGSNPRRSRALAIILLVAIASVFWVDSRYPALLKRYHAGSQVKAVGALTFGAVYSVDRNMTLATRVWRTTINWLDANRIGMTFSFLFGPAALTFLATLRRRRSKSRWLNTIFGVVAGVPLGVCTNCVAPIARGLFASGMSTESVLATMFASPALNVVVLAMTFTLFPISVALIKLATVLFLICVFVPIVAFRQGRSQPLTTACLIEIPMSETWTEAFVGIARSYARNFWYVFRVAFPLMLLAAALGAFVVELLPPQALIAQVTVGGILLVALISAFLPVPMAFDVAIAYIAMTRGVPLPYVVTILCTLGIVSVYSLSIVGKSLSWRVAAAGYATVVALGTVSGFIARGIA
jgi:uncharacterized membrane protein YraQ (UPF0718 family)